MYFTYGVVPRDCKTFAHARTNCGRKTLRDPTPNQLCSGTINTDAKPELPSPHDSIRYSRHDSHRWTGAQHTQASPAYLNTYSLRVSHSTSKTLGRWVSDGQIPQIRPLRRRRLARKPQPSTSIAKWSLLYSRRHLKSLRNWAPWESACSQAPALDHCKSWTLACNDTI